MICDEDVNVTDLALFRPVRTGAGGDESADPVTLATDLRAHYEVAGDSFKDGRGRELFVTGKFWIDPVDENGEVIDVRADDHLQYSDFRGKLQKRQRIVRVSPFWCGGELDHILLEIG